MELRNDSTLFLSGDYEAQKLCRKWADMQSFLVRHFLYSILLSTRVNMPVGCYYQSEYTRSLVYEYEKLYLPYKSHPELAELSIGDDRDSFAEDAKIKKSWFPEDYVYTDDMEIDQLTKGIANIQPSIRSGKMRSRLTANISKDISEGSQVRKTLEEVNGSREGAAELVKPLRKVIEVQEYAILPAYIQIEMQRHGLSDTYGQQRWLDFILFKAYSQSCKDAYGSYCNNPLSIFYDKEFRRIYPFQLDYRDTNLFQQFINIFPFYRLDKIERLKPTDIIAIKHSDDFRLYVNCYKQIVETLKNELQTVILEDDAHYDKFREILHKQQIEDFGKIKMQLVNNVQESLMLYKILRNPFTRTGRFKNWMKANNGELPTMQLLSCIKDKKHGILQEYIRELFQQSKNVYVKERRTIMKKNIFLGIGNSNVTQKIDSENKNLLSGCEVDSIHQEDFKAISQQEIDRFIDELSKETGTDVQQAKKALLSVMNARYASTAEEYEDYLRSWKEEKKSFSEKAKSALQIAAQVAGILSFFSKLMGI